MIDLTLPFSKDLRPFPGDPEIKITRWKSFSKDGWNETFIACSAHTGTHLDAPLHFAESGKSAEKIPLEWCRGRACCLDARKKKEIGPEILPPRLPSIVLFYTGWTENTRRPRYFEDYPVLTMELVQALIRGGARMVGIDAPSIERTPYNCHRLLARHNRLILESLANLKKVAGKKFTLSAFPLPIRDGDASPVRVVAQLI